MGPNVVSSRRQEARKCVSEYRALGCANVDWSGGVRASMLNNGPLWSMRLEESVLGSILSNGLESELCEPCKVCAEIHVARLSRLNRFDKVEFCDFLCGLSNVLATSIGLFFWIFASSKLSELARCPKVGLGGSSRVDPISRLGKLCPQVFLRDEYPAFNAVSHSRLKDPKGSD